jgi:hypothetical protein
MTIVLTDRNFTTFALPSTKTRANARLTALTTATALQGTHVLRTTHPRVILVTLTLARGNTLPILASRTDGHLTACSAVSRVTLARAIFLACSVFTALIEAGTFLAVAAVEAWVAYAVAGGVLAVATRLGTTIIAHLFMTERGQESRRALAHTRSNSTSHGATLGNTL